MPLDLVRPPLQCASMGVLANRFEGPPHAGFEQLSKERPKRRPLRLPAPQRGGLGLTRNGCPQPRTEMHKGSRQCTPM
eukprot:NODE_18704_length_880_cov_13.217795.p3 GENE.NODE_18704_length_880_cov_13.217795~~NODE_18704_length_880_cov_13.217795.p3  ORF type:complete len:78 (-),score=3.70 NODE_18704_length_880_cov_13.217795:37-270(-)